MKEKRKVVSGDEPWGGRERRGKRRDTSKPRVGTGGWEIMSHIHREHISITYLVLRSIRLTLRLPIMGAQAALSTNSSYRACTDASGWGKRRLDRRFPAMGPGTRQVTGVRVTCESKKSRKASRQA